MSILKVRSALEARLMTIAGMVNISSSSIAASTVITTPTPHGLMTGMDIYISGHTGSTPTINGARIVTVLSANTFSIPVTVTVAGTGGAFTLTSFENRPFTPPSPFIPYQQAYLLPAQPDDLGFSDKYREKGIFQITLRYPLINGPVLSATRAELIRTSFKRKTTLTKDNVTVIIQNTPTIEQSRPDGDRFVTVIRCVYYANIT